MGFQEDTATDTGGISLFGNSAFVVVLLIQFVGLFGTNVPSPALADMATGLGVTDARIGLVMMAFSLPAIVMVPLVGMLIDIYGRRRIVLASLLLMGTAGIGIVFIRDFWLILGLRVLQGIGYAGTTPITITLISDLYSDRTASTAQGYLISASGAASILVPSAAGYLAGLSWELTFGLYGVVLVVWGIAYAYLPETLPQREGTSDVDVVASLGGYLNDVRSEVHDADIAVLYSGALVEYFIKYGVLTFLPLFVIRILGLTPFVAGFLVSLYGGIRVVVSPLTGKLVEAVGQRWALVVAGALVFAGIGSLFLSTSLAMLVVPMCVYSVGDSFLAPLLNDAVATRASEEHKGGVVSGLNMMKNVGKTLAPAALGLVLTLVGYRTMFLLSAFTLVPYLVVVLTTLRLAEPTA